VHWCHVNDFIYVCDLCGRLHVFSGVIFSHVRLEACNFHEIRNGNKVNLIAINSTTVRRRNALNCYHADTTKSQVYSYLITKTALTLYISV